MECEEEEEEAAPEDAPKPCSRPSCTAFLHTRCRKLLATRVQVYWPHDKEWWWGTADPAREDAEHEGEIFVRYDDGVEQFEEPEDLTWLITRAPDESPGVVAARACTCAKDCASNESTQRFEEQLRVCAVCRTDDVRDGSEPGVCNEMMFCEVCNVSVHVFCYGQANHGELFGRKKNATSISFICDHCTHVTAGHRPAQCSLCPFGDGILRPQLDGTWAHNACVLYNNALQFGRKNARQHAEQQYFGQLCTRKSGCNACLKNKFELSDNGKHVRAAIRSMRCGMGGKCPNPTHTNGLVPCGGQGPKCQRAVHVSCAQRIDSGWHVRLIETENAAVAEVLCLACHDCWLETPSQSRPRWRQAVVPQLTAAVDKYVTPEQLAAAKWTFFDCFHGPCGAFTRVGARLGGLCIGACDSDSRARTTYLSTFGHAMEPLHNITEMGADPRVAMSATIMYCGFCCKPFSTAGHCRGFDDENYGNNLELLMTALNQRLIGGLWDECLICENVPNLLSFLTLHHLKQLGFYCHIYVVSGVHFRCANVRERLVLVGFRNKDAYERFTPPPPQATTPTPLRTVLKNFTTTTGDSLFISAKDFKQADEGSHVVGRGWPSGARSPTSSYGSLRTPGTLVCVKQQYDTREAALALDDIKKLHYGELRKLHPDELLASFSFRQDEMPRLMGNWTEQYNQVCQTICLNVFEAFSAEALAALGKYEPREQLYARLDGMGVEAHRIGTPASDDAAPDWLDARYSKHGVRFEKYVLGSTVKLHPEDDLCDYERQNRQNQERNRIFLEELERDMERRLLERQRQEESDGLDGA